MILKGNGRVDHIKDKLIGKTSAKYRRNNQTVILLKVSYFCVPCKDNLKTDSLLTFSLDDFKGPVVFFFHESIQTVS